MEVLLILGEPLLLIVLGACIIFLMGAAYVRIRRKGYGQFASGLILVASPLVGIGVAFIYPSSSEFVTGMRVYAACVVFMFAAVACLPRRQRRIFGQRRTKFPFEVVGWLITFGGGTPAAALATYGFWPNIALMAWASVIAFGLFYMLGHPFVLRGRFLASQRTLETELAEDPRPPVLYIRPFEREGDAFVVGDKSRYGLHKTRFIDSSKIRVVIITFEDYLAVVIRDLIGPFVALGSPQDSWAPVGAARTYAKDGTWQDEFDQLVRSAGAILVEVARSQNLRWEFEHIRKVELHQRLFLVTRHATMSRPLRWPWLRWLNRGLARLSGASSFSWSEFSSELRACGYRVDIDDPGPGAVVTFDAEAVATVIATGADLPEDFVKPIAAHIEAVTVRL